MAEALHRARLARGERVVGRKIGFTNRTIWPLYGVHEPIWGHVYDTTVVYAQGGRAEVPVGPLPEPRIEPEIVLHFASAPPVTRDEAAILACVDWIAHGFEIVQSPFRDWKFKLADTVAANGLHGALVIGPPVPVAGIADCVRKLREFRLTLLQGRRAACRRDRRERARFAAARVRAFRRRARAAAAVRAGGRRRGGDHGNAHRRVSGAAGETWSTRLDGIELPGLAITFR